MLFKLIVAAKDSWACSVQREDQVFLNWGQSQSFQQIWQFPWSTCLNIWNVICIVVLKTFSNKYYCLLAANWTQIVFTQNQTEILLTSKTIRYPCSIKFFGGFGLIVDFELKITLCYHVKGLYDSVQYIFMTMI